MHYIDTALLVLCLSGLLGQTVWAYNNFQEIRDRMAKHENKAGVHVDAETFVKKEMCNLQVQMLNQGVEVVKVSMDKLEKSFAAGLSELKQMIMESRHQHGPH